MTKIANAIFHAAGRGHGNKIFTIHPPSAIQENQYDAPADFEQNREFTCRKGFVVVARKRDYSLRTIWAERRDGNRRYSLRSTQARKLRVWIASGNITTRVHFVDLAVIQAFGLVIQQALEAMASNYEEFACLGKENEFDD